MKTVIDVTLPSTNNPGLGGLQSYQLGATRYTMRWEQGDDGKLTTKSSLGNLTLREGLQLFGENFLAITPSIALMTPVSKSAHGEVGKAYYYPANKAYFPKPFKLDDRVPPEAVDKIQQIEGLKETYRHEQTAMAERDSTYRTLLVDLESEQMEIERLNNVINPLEGELETQSQEIQRLRALLSRNS